MLATSSDQCREKTIDDVLTEEDSGDALDGGDMLLWGGNTRGWWANQQTPKSIKAPDNLQLLFENSNAIGNQILGSRSLSARIAGTVQISS